MPDALDTIAQYESGGQNIPNYEYSLQHTASGYYQINVSTWNSVIAPGTGLPAVSYSSPVSSLSVAQQQQGAAYLFQTEGFSPWTCPGCNAALASYVQSQGGSSAFTLGGSTPTSLGTPGLSASQVDPSTSGTSTSFSGTVFQPFSWIWQEFQSAVATPLSNEIAQIQQLAGGPLGGLLVLDIAIVGILVLYGMTAFSNIWSKFFRVLMVVPLLMDQGWYQQWVVAPVLGTTSWLAQGVGVAGMTTNPASMFDSVVVNYWSHVVATWQKVPWGFWSVFLDGSLLAGSLIVVVVAMVVLFCAWIVAQALIELLLVLGPVLLLGLLFDYTRSLFDRWVSTLILFILVTFTVDMLSALFLGILTAALAQVSPTNSAMADVWNLVGVAIVVLVMAGSLSVMVYLLQSIAQVGAAPRMDWAQRWLARNLYQPVSRLPRRLF